jgi:hypothetical protein
MGSALICSLFVPAPSLSASLFRHALRDAHEFGEMAPQLALKPDPAALRTSRDAKFPENFPVHGNSTAETGSHESAHTARKKRPLAGRFSFLTETAAL